jgi:DNA-binding NarL/FixJ family response regulator
MRQAMRDKDHYCVLLVDDHHMMRLGLKLICQTNSTLPIRFIEAGSLSDAFDAYAAGSHVDLVLLDMNLPDSQGLQSLQRFLSHHAKARVAIFSATEDEFVIKQAMALGAVGFVPKSAQAADSLRLIEALLAGHQALNETRPGSLQPHYLASRPQVAVGTDTDNLRDRVDRLTTRQLKILELVLAGMSNQAIASDCNLALGTVKNTVSSILIDLDVSSRAHLISVFR